MRPTGRPRCTAVRRVTSRHESNFPPAGRASLAPRVRRCGARALPSSLALHATAHPSGSRTFGASTGWRPLECLRGKQRHLAKSRTRSRNSNRLGFAETDCSKSAPHQMRMAGNCSGSTLQATVKRTHCPQSSRTCVCPVSPV